MEYSYPDLQRTDPFLSLDVNLDDIHSVVHSDAMECYPAMDTSNQWNHHQPSSSAYHHNHFARANQHSPPQQYYDPNKSQEIGSVMTLLQSDSPPHHDPYATIKFSPPNFDSPNGYNSTARMLSQLGTPQPENSFQPGSLAQKLAAPAMQPLPALHSPPAMYVDGQMSPPYTYKPAKMEPAMPAEPVYNSPRKPSNTKEELLRLLVNMSPSEVEMLKNRDTRPRPSAVATRVTRDQKWKDDDMSDVEDDPPEEMPIRRGPKTERRTAHNLIERKYRCSINDRIQHLKTILGGEDTKLSKSATLRKAIDHISNLESENAALKSELGRLTSILVAHKIDIPPPPMAPLSPTFSNPASTSGIESLESPDTTSPSSPVNSMKGNKRAKMDQARLSIFAFMFAMLVWNPVSFLAGTASANQDAVVHHALPMGGRVLDNDDSFDPYYSENWWQTNVIRPGFVWSVNIFVVVCVLIRLLVYGEPVQDFKSRSWATFLSFRQRARVETEAGNVKEAMRLYMECLQILERPLPSAGLDSLISVCWQIVRHTLNGLWIGRWFSRRKRNALKPVTVVCKSHAHTAIIYHKLHQLHLLGVDETYGSVSGLYLALSAVNLAESAGVSADGLPRSVMADIYTAAGIRTRMCLYGPFAKIVSMYFYKRARRHIRRSEDNSVNGLLWMFHPLSRNFLASSEVLESSLTDRPHHVPFSSENLDASPIAKLRSHFKLHLLKLLAAELSGSLEENIDIIDVSRLLLSMSTGGGIPKKENDWNCDTSISDGDALCSWWTHVLTCALHWKQGRNEMAKKHYTVVRQCPKELLNEPLALAVGHSFCARKICIEDRENVKFGKFVFVHSQHALETMRNVHRKEDKQIQELQDSLSILAYEWVLTSLLDAWRVEMNAEVPYWVQTPKFDYRILYQEATNHYVHLSDREEGNGGSRTLVYQLTCRMLNGCNPIETMTNLSRVRKQIISVASGNGGQISRADQPDPFHLHVLTKLHSNLAKRSELIK